MSPEQIRLTSDQAVYFYDQVDAVAAAPDALSHRERVLRLRQIFEQILKEASRGAREPLADTFKRSVYVLNETHAKKPLIDAAHQFRRLANRCVHEMDFDVRAEYVLFGAQTLADLTGFLSEVELPSLTPAPVVLDDPPAAHPQQIALLRGVVVPQESVRLGEFVCAVEDPDEFGRIVVELDEYWAVTLLPPYATIAVHNLTHVSAGRYRVTPQSLLVLHPDLLISATSLAECFDDNGISPALYGISKFRPSAVKTPMLIGSVLGNLFSQAIRNPKVSIEDAFRQAARANVLAFAQLGSESDAQIYNDAKRMFEVLGKTLKDYRLPQSFTETTLLSATYGMQGRMDGVFIDPQMRTARVAELKSGKPPLPTQTPTLPGFSESRGMRVKDLSQALTYQMLMNSALPELTTEAHVFYPKDALLTARPAKSNALTSRSLMRVRNTVAAHDWSMALDEAGVVKQLQEPVTGPVPFYLQEHILLLRESLTNATALERAYFTAFVGLIAREWLTARIGTTNPDATSNGFARLWRDDLDAKERDFLAISVLVRVAYDADNRIVTFQTQREGGMAPTSLRSGDPIVLYRHQPDLSALPLRGLLMRGEIYEIRAQTGEVLVELYDAPVDTQMDGLWAIEPYLFENLYTYQFRALARFLRAPIEKRRIFLGLEAPRKIQLVKDPVRTIPLMDGGVTTDLQHGILKDALSAQDYFLLQGPPGTGKTSVMVRMLMQHLSAETNENVLLLAFTNRAVDEMCAAIEGVCDFVKLGNSASLKNKQHALEEYSRTHTVPETRAHIKRSRVFVATVASLLGRPELLELKKFDTAIVDEASQLLEPHLAGILPFVGRFILIGDEKQLPAVITQSPEQAKSVAPELIALGIADDLGVTDLRTSLFERLLRACQRNEWPAYGMLQAQSRMHEKIQDFPSRRFYGGKLVPRADAQRQPSRMFSANSAMPLERALAVSRVVFIPVPPQKGVRTNAKEAEVVAQVLDLFHARYMKVLSGDVASERAAAEAVKKLGVITPFRAQISEIHRALSPEMQRHSIEIDTVERYQGGQRDTIIVSFCVNHAVQLPSMQSLNQDKSVDRKLNVALTRAQNYLVLIGAEEVLSRDPHYAALIEHVRATGGYAGLTHHDS